MKSIKSRLVLYMLLTTIIPIVALLIYSLVFVNRDVIKTEIDDNETKISWAAQYLESVSDQLTDVLYSIHIEDSLLQKVDESNIESASIEDILRGALYSNANLISKIKVYSINTNRSASFDFENGYNSAISDFNEPFIDYGLNPTGIGYYEFDGDIYVYQTINEFDDQSLNGMIIMKLNDNILNELAGIFGTETNIVLLNTNSIIYSEDETKDDIIKENLEQIGFSIYQVTTSDKMIWIKQVSNQNLYVSSIVDKSLIQGVNSNIIIIGFIIILISLATSIPTSIILSNWITSPIIRLVNHMKDFNFSTVQDETKIYNEINLLERSYNQMIQEVNSLIKERYKNKIDKQEAQLKALHAQINPHFLANTFQLIGGMALSANVENIYDATIKMSNLVRYSMQLNQEAVTLNEELSHMNDYLSIQKLRFGEHLELTISISDELLDVKIPKFTLQPILENTFKHGLKNIDSIWEISINSEINDSIHIIIGDNGKGLSPKKLDKINNQFQVKDNYLQNLQEEDFSGIGLTNIDSRIKLLFGNEYGLKLINNEKKGVATIITLPIHGGKL